MTYYTLLNSNVTIEVARSMGYGILIFANVFLVFENASDNESIFHTIKKLKKEKAVWIVNGITVIHLLLMLYTPLAGLLKLTALSFREFIIMTILSMLAVFWYELVKFVRQKI